MKGKELEHMKIFKRLIAGGALLLPAAVSEAAEGGGAVPDITEGWHHLWQELLLDITIIGIIFAAVTLYLLIRYRRRKEGEEGKASRLSPLASLGWVLIPAFIFLADDVFLAAKNFELWNKMREVPEGAYEVKVEAYMWGWDITYPGGATATNEIRVPEGTPIKVSLTSRDVVHSFFIPDFKVKWDTVPGMETYLWFYPKTAGEHVMTCAEFCGVLHSSMHGKVIVMPEAEFEKWIEENTPRNKEA